MKLTSLVRDSLVGMACVGFMAGTVANASEQKSRAKNSMRQYRYAEVAQPKPTVVLVDVTGSRIPQRVVIGGQQVNSGSPLFVVRSESSGLGATSIYGMLRLDPSISMQRSH